MYVKRDICKLLKIFNLQHCNPTQLPIDPNTHLQKWMDTKKTNPTSYRSLVGSLRFLTYTWPDISYAVSCVSRFVEEPKIAHFQAAKKILCSLSKTYEYGLFFPSRNTAEYHTYANTNWGRDLDSRYSTSRVVHKLGNSIICWSSKLQPTITLSSTKSKYRVLIDAARDVICFRRLLQELCIGQTEPTTLLSNNQFVILPDSIGPF